MPSESSHVPRAAFSPLLKSAAAIAVVPSITLSLVATAAAVATPTVAAGCTAAAASATAAAGSTATVTFCRTELLSSRLLLAKAAVLIDGFEHVAIRVLVLLHPLHRLPQLLHLVLHVLRQIGRSRRNLGAAGGDI